MEITQEEKADLQKAKSSAKKLIEKIDEYLEYSKPEFKVGDIVSSEIFIDGSGITYSNVSEQYSNEILSMFNVKLHVLKEGDKFDLLKKIPFEEDKYFHENHR